MAKLLVFNPTTSASAGLIRIEIFTTINSISCKPIILNRNIYTMKMMSKAAATTQVVTTMKATATITMTLLNRQKRNKRLGVAGTV